MPKISDTDGKSSAIGCWGREEERREEKLLWWGLASELLLKLHGYQFSWRDTLWKARSGYQVEKITFTGIKYG